MTLQYPIISAKLVKTILVIIVLSGISQIAKAQCPVINAGVDFEICEDETPTLNGSAINSTSVLWDNGTGDGTFSDPNILNPIYFPGPLEIAARVVNLTLTNTGPTPCGGTFSDNLTITIQPNPTMDAGIDLAVCGMHAVPLNGTAVDHDPSSVLWSSPGGGVLFSDPTILNPTYTPSVADLANGTVMLILQVSGSNPCTNTVTDNLTLTINDNVTVYAGIDDTICEGPYNLVATVENASTINWTIATVGGDGTFSDNTMEDPVYTPGPNDVANGFVVLTINGQSPAPCTGTDTDNVILYIIPDATVSAGNDTTVCALAPNYTLTNSSTTIPASIQWSTNGDGTFNNDQILHPTYVPGATDIANGSVTLTIRSENPPCAPAEAQMTLTIQSTQVNAGNDETVCTGEPVYITTASSTGTSILWTTTNGTGSFSDSTIINPTYNPSAGDYLLSPLILQIEGTALSPCSGTAIPDQVLITFTNPPTAYAGIDTLICETSSYTISTSSATNYSSLEWTTSGDGSWDDETELFPTYTPGPTDITSGTVAIMLTAQPNNGCSVPAISFMTLSIQANAEVTVNNDSVCADNPIITITSATASNCDNLIWTTSGSGFFSSSNIINPTYTPSPADIANGTVQLTLTGISIAPCGTDASETMTLTIVPIPTAYAGADATFCEDGTYQILDSDAESYSNIVWLTSGDGGFSNVNDLHPIYTPGINDRIAGTATLQITTIGISPCSNPATDDMVITLDPLPIINAGINDFICDDGSVFSTNNASVLFTSTTEWTSLGDGYFTNKDLVSTIYTPGTNDISNGSVILILTGDSQGTCSGNVSDSLLLTIIPEPTVDAGHDEIICELAFALLNASAENYSTVLWTSSGSSGTLANATP